MELAVEIKKCLFIDEQFSESNITWFFLRQMTIKITRENKIFSFFKFHQNLKNFENCIARNAIFKTMQTALIPTWSCAK